MPTSPLSSTSNFPSGTRPTQSDFREIDPVAVRALPRHAGSHHHGRDASRVRRATAAPKRQTSSSGRPFLGDVHQDRFEHREVLVRVGRVTDTRQRIHVPAADRTRLPRRARPASPRSAGRPSPDDAPRPSRPEASRTNQPAADRFIGRPFDRSIELADPAGELRVQPRQLTPQRRHVLTLRKPNDLHSSELRQPRRAG